MRKGSPAYRLRAPLLVAAVKAREIFGYKSFDNGATNLKLLALVTSAEDLHNNSHVLVKEFTSYDDSVVKEGRSE